MRIFRCDFCGNALYFENVACLRCGSALAFLPDRMDLCAIEPAGAGGLWRRKVPQRPRAGHRWRLCQHHDDADACNFAIPQHDPQALCVSCRQTRVLPDLSVPGNPRRWYRIEAAKRRLFFSLARLGLVPADPAAASQADTGPTYELLADLPGQPVTTGHRGGVITLNIAEADDDERTRRRVALHEPYRTLLGHLRHESGHYYWERRVAGRGGRRGHEAFRAAFGDERQDYAAALQRHYQAGGTGPPDWPQRFVSAYACAHPWEDWAETWAHYLHMVDLLETAASHDTRLAVPRQDTAPVEEVADPFEGGPPAFDEMVAQWVPLTLLVNSLNRSLGQDDAYPFALSPAALDKLRFVHELVRDTTPGA